MDLLVVCTPGLEKITAAELESLGAVGLVGIEGGVELRGTLEDVQRTNLRLRTASRVLVRLGRFPARDAGQLERGCARLAWQSWLAPGRAMSVRVSCHRSRLNGERTVRERVLRAAAACLGWRPALVSLADAERSDDPPQLVVVRVVDDTCAISLDSSGALLHRRGYRLATAKAPLRETLAAGILLASGWDRSGPLLDPFCGSGTIAIEGALLARDLAVGRDRRFAFMHWPGFEARAWQRLRLAALDTGGDHTSPIILGSDRDAGAIAAATANAERAGVAGIVDLSHRAVSAIEPPAGPGWVVTNPPYGVRTGAGGVSPLRNLYAQLGNVLRARCPGWQVALLCSDPALARETGLRFDSQLRLVNGGLKVTLWRGRVAP